MPYVPIKVRLRSLMPKAYGYAHKKRGLIEIDKDLDAESMGLTVAHELYHIYDDAAIESKVEAFEEDLKHAMAEAGLKFIRIRTK